jgi:protein-L-isoaspartate(D-aspartate) O-methyltransferase
MSMNIEQARFNMVEQQIRPWEVLDTEVLELLFKVKRELFVPPEHRDLAFADLEIPIGHGETMMQPKVEARLLQELAIGAHENVYEVGTGSGYLTALLANRGRHVTSAEIHADLGAQAAENLRRAGVPNVTLVTGDSSQSILADAAVDVIVVTGSMPIVPRAFLERLTPGGRLFAVVGDAPVMEATLIRKADQGALQSVKLFETMLKPLVNAQQPSRFRF